MDVAEALGATKKFVSAITKIEQDSVAIVNSSVLKDKSRGVVRNKDNNSIFLLPNTHYSIDLGGTHMKVLLSNGVAAFPFISNFFFLFNRGSDCIEPLYYVDMDGSA